jgi:hypothetical protein
VLLVGLFPEDFVSGIRKNKVSGFRFQVSAGPLTAEVGQFDQK